MIAHRLYKGCQLAARVSFISFYIPKLLLSNAVVVIHSLLIAPSYMWCVSALPLPCAEGITGTDATSVACSRETCRQELLGLSGVE